MPTSSIDRLDRGRLPTMTIRRSLALRLAVLVLFTLPFVNVSAALASCAPPDPLDRVIANSEVVLVGTVTALANDGRWAKVSVEEIWKGGPLAAVVEVRGALDPGAATSGDRSFNAARYLFTVSRDGASLADNACSGTTVWTDDLAALRPADWTGPNQAEPVLGDGMDLGFVAPLAGVGLVAIVILGGAMFVARRRQA